MKKTIYIIFVALAGLAAASCSEREMGLRPGEQGIVLNLSTLDGAEAAVRSNGVDALNENLLNSFYYFFYPLGAETSAPALSGFVSGISETVSYSRTVPVSSHIVNNILFKNDRNCRLFVVANPTADIEAALEGTPTLQQLRAMVLESALNNVPQDNFVMVYDDIITATSFSSETVVNATVPLRRLACKFSIGAYVTQSIDDGKKIYTPTEEGLSVMLCNAASRTTLGGFSATEMSASDYFNTNEVNLVHQSGLVTISAEDENLYHKYNCSSPVYTYPMEWEFASEQEPYLLYCLNWMITDKTTGSTDYRALYYKLTLGRRSIFSNEWYNISAKLTVLGSLYPEDPKEVFPGMNYQVLGWNQAFDLETNPNTPAVIKDTRYLAVPQLEWTVNNKEELTIPYSSSHECEIANAKMIKVSYSSGTKVETTTNLNPASATPVKFDLSTMNVLTVTHKLNNTLGATMDVTPITIEFDLRHNDDENFTEHIKITQYPAIYLETFANSGGRSSTNDYGYTYVNNSQSGDWQTVSGANGSGDNSSIYLTVITVTQFDPSTGFFVGDPRTPEEDNLDINTASAGVQWNDHNPVSVTAKYSGDGQTGNRQIKYYHPTIDDGSMDNCVAPSFRVNSANCRSGRNETYENARQRCAAYQEDGYPAGRWRLPTLAECKLIQTMSSNGIVPTIFIQGSTSYYCYSGGWFAGTASRDSDYHPYNGTPSYSKTTRTGGSGGGAARCVYDEWYWSQIDKEFGWDNSDKTTFTWGDIPDNYTHPASAN